MLDQPTNDEKCPTQTAVLARQASLCSTATYVRGSHILPTNTLAAEHNTNYGCKYMKLTASTVAGCCCYLDIIHFCTPSRLRTLWTRWTRFGLLLAQPPIAAASSEKARTHVVRVARSSILIVAGEECGSAVNLCHAAVITQTELSGI